MTNQTTKIMSEKRTMRGGICAYVDEQRAICSQNFGRLVGKHGFENFLLRLDFK